MLRTSIIAAVVLAVAAGIWWKLRDEAPAASGASIVEVTVPELTREARNGKTTFDANCAECHGENAAGSDGAGPPLVHKIYEPSHHGDMAFVMAVRRGVRAHHWPFGDMAPVEGVADRQVAQIVAYVRALQRANGID